MTSSPFVRAVVVGLDAGKVSGIAALVPGPNGPVLAMHGDVADHAKDRAAAADTCARLALDRNLPLVLMAERWPSGGPFGGHRTMQGLAARFGGWREAFLCVGLSQKYILRVYPATWRSRVLSIRNDGDLSRSVARQYVLARFRVEVPEDCAEAVCIAVYGTQSADVINTIPR